jgi:hypothetical protein
MTSYCTARRHATATQPLISRTATVPIFGGSDATRSQAIGFSRLDSLGTMHRRIVSLPKLPSLGTLAQLLI